MEHSIIKKEKNKRKKIKKRRMTNKNKIERSR